MLAIELDAPPVDEMVGRGTLTPGQVERAPGGGHTQGVFIEEHPVASTGHATRTGIEPDGDPLVGEVVPLARHLVGVGECGAIIHGAPRFDARSRWPPCVALGQTGEIGTINRRVLRRILAFEIGFPQVMDHIVLLRWHHPGLRGHLAKTTGECLV